MKHLCSALIASALALTAAMPARAETRIEVLHHWVSESEVAALNTIRTALAARGYGWQDSAVGGMSGGNMQQALRSRLAAGNPPGAMQFIGWEGIDWSAEGVIRNLDALDKANGWQATIPPQVLPFVRNGDDLIAVPINMHRQNWVWANKAAFDKAGIQQPRTWAELIADGDKLKAAGIIPLAMGDEPWQIQVIFDALVADIGGPDFYRKALVDLDPEALSSDTMKQVFDTLRQVRGLVDDGFNGRDWAVATGMVIDGQAAMQVMGDWAKGEFIAANKAPGKDFQCAAAPGTANAFTFNVDSFILFKLKDAAAQKAQSDLASSIMSPEFQEVFNLNKGSIPVRTGQKMDKFDDCAKLSSKDFADTAKSGGLVPSVAHGMAIAPATEGAIKDVVSQFWNDDKVSVADAMKKIAAAAKTK